MPLPAECRRALFFAQPGDAPIRGNRKHPDAWLRRTRSIRRDRATKKPGAWPGLLLHRARRSVRLTSRQGDTDEAEAK
jgi:hypothetical protein